MTNPYVRPNSRTRSGQYPGFVEMRARLVERGMIDGEYRITPAGSDYAGRIIDDLREQRRTFDMAAAGERMAA